MSGSYVGQFKSSKVGRKRAAQSARRALRDALADTASAQRRFDGKAREAAHNAALTAHAAIVRQRNAELVRPDLDTITARRGTGETWRDIARDYALSSTALEKAFRDCWRERKQLTDANSV